METTCCVIGQRPQELPWKFDESDPRCIRLKCLLEEQILNMIENHGVRKFILGIDRGTETYVAEIIVELKKRYPISFYCALANEEMRYHWLEEEADRFYNILEQSDGEFLLECRASEESMDNRNKFMVNKSNFVLLVSDGHHRAVSEDQINYLKKHKKVMRVNTAHYHVSPLLTLVK